MSGHTFVQQKLNEDPRVLNQCLRELKQLINETGRPRFGGHRMDDQFLTKFIRAEKYDTKMAHRKCCAYEEFRENHPELTQLNAVKLIDQLGKGAAFILPNYDHQERSICYIKLHEMHFGSREEGLKWLHLFYYLSEKVVLDEHSQIDGVLLICDAKSTSLSKNFSRKHMKMAIDMFQGRSPCRVGMLCLLREPSLARFLWKIASPFLSERFRSRIRFVGDDLESLKDILDPRILPKDVGGEWEPRTEQWVEKLIRAECEEMVLRAKCPKHSAAFDLGFSVKERCGKVIVESVKKRGIGHSLGMQEDDVLISLNDTPIREERDLLKIQTKDLSEIRAKIARPKPI